MSAKAVRVPLTQERLKELLCYDTSTGIFTRLVTSGYGANLQAGAVAGCKCKHNGYVLIRVDGLLYLAHRLAWLYVHGEWPEHQIDHKDTIRDHNWIDNLRPATNAQNQQNHRGAQRRNRTGLLGVSWHKQNKRWRAVIGVNGKYKHLGCFDTPGEAHAAYISAKAVMHPFQPTIGCPS